MVKPEEMGNPQTQVMALITQLEQKVREKNQKIEELKEESDRWRLRYLLGEAFLGGWGVVTCLVIGAMGGGGMVWLVMTHVR